ncbi:uncharacterized protein LOC126375407 [Pectinophora gossypiella]|uniref:uncharacterized protein LOC126375407 n=1 Tax=Pectinophora gossypiella TaxID=13191 RepID=UPI00214E3709|nr:uncharacterized protein LOC126375407 [Pectinophora gossypiella]
MAPPTAGVSKRMSRVFVSTRLSNAITATATSPALPPIARTYRPPVFPRPLPQLPGTEAAAKRTATPPERPLPQLRTKTSPPVALSMPSLDMETSPPRTFCFAPTNPFSPPSMSRPDTEITPPRSYAAVLNTNPDSPPHAPPRPSLRTTPTPSPPKKTAQQPPLAPASRKIPPIVVDQLPNWPHHFRQLREVLGHVPNARPATGLSWFAYAPPAERSLKLAILGLPVDTNPTELEEELRNRGFCPEYVRPIQGKRGCVFFVEMKRTKDFHTIYETTELLCMPGVKVEAWRGRKGPSQCHRCQQFRHSSHNCHRPVACVRCGESHAAKDCLRPREVPATCCNCGGGHPANSPSCPVKLRELRNTKAGTAPMTTARRAPLPPPPSTVDPSSEPTARSSLMAAANGPDGPKPRRPKRIRARAKPAPAASITVEPQPTPTPNQAVAAPPRGGKKAKPQVEEPSAPSSEKLEVLEQTIQLLHNVLAAIRSRIDPVPIIFIKTPDFTL